MDSHDLVAMVDALRHELRQLQEFDVTERARVSASDLRDILATREPVPEATLPLRDLLKALQEATPSGVAASLTALRSLESEFKNRNMDAWDVASQSLVKTVERNQLTIVSDVQERIDEFLEPGTLPTRRLALLRQFRDQIEGALDPPLRNARRLASELQRALHVDPLFVL